MVKDKNRVECWNCDGLGYTEQEKEKFVDGFQVGITTKKRCVYCNGKGYRFEDDY